MKVLIWATTFGADLLSLTRYLDRRDDVLVKVLMPRSAGYLHDGAAALFPMKKTEILDRGVLAHLLGVPGFTPDVTILDNRVPLVSTSACGFVLWHGFGWKGPNDVHEFRHLHRRLCRCFGETMRENPRFRWQCFGPFDFRHRTEVSGFHPANCRLIGAVSHDFLRHSLDKAYLQPFYPFDVVRRQTVLIAPTWHYGEVFAHWGSDGEIFDRLLAKLSRRGANVILRLHDSWRFEKPYRNFLSDLPRKHRNLLLKFKDSNPDSLLDLQVADALITNYSSIANLYYATRRPTIHVYPVRSADEAFAWRTVGIAGVKEKKVSSVRYLWKLPPEDHGGLMARNEAEMLTQVDLALDDPVCCVNQSGAFLHRHMLGADGMAAERAFQALREQQEEYLSWT